jgi:chaperonin GroES
MSTRSLRVHAARAMDTFKNAKAATEETNNLFQHTYTAATKGAKELREISMKFRPLHDRVVVKRIDADEKSTGGIIIPDTAKEKPSQGEITAVGPGGRDEAGELVPIDLKVGDHVLFGKWSGTEVKIEGVELLIMKESDIMGVLDEPVAKRKAA